LRCRIITAIIEIFSVFGNKEKLIKASLCALVFVGIAVPFKVMVIIPGLTEVRPVNAIPIVAGLLFGPAGAWGCAFGNLAADVFGTFSIGSVFGFLGNFAAAYLPYKIWHMSGSGEAPNVKTHKNIWRFIFISAFSSLSVAVIISWGLDVLNIVWGSHLFLIILLNDLGFSLFLGLPVFIVLTSDQMNNNSVINQTFYSNKMDMNIKRILLLTAAVSGTVFSLYIFTGMRLIQSSAMLISSIVFGTMLLAFIIKK
jgi:energy-coupling factor transport system substrate-specific component